MMQVESALPLSFCPECQMLRLTFRAVDLDDNLLVLCLSCESTLGESGTVEEHWFSEAELGEVGYALETVKPSGGAGGCGSGGGCSSGGCGSKKKPKREAQAFDA
jgi:hypothetical protein